MNDAFRSHPRPRDVSPNAVARFARTVAVLAAVVVTTLLSAAPAHAETFGRQGDLSFSADRLMGIYFLDEGPSFTAVGLGSSLLNHPYTIGRLGVDYFVIDQLSIGGSVSFWSLDRDPGNGGTGAMLAPRVGYVLEFNDVFGFWPRGGFTFRGFDGDDEFALTLEAMFYASPVDHFAFTFGPVMDLGLVGDGEEAKNFGLITGGLMGWL